MADYYTQSVVLPSELTLTPLLIHALEFQGATIEYGDTDNVLDHLVSDGKRSKCYVFFENGYNNAGEEQFDSEIGYNDELKSLTKDEMEEFKNLALMGEPELFREVLLVNPNKECIEVHIAHTCSSMRDDGFGGGGLYVTRTQFMYIGDESAFIQDGKIKSLARPHLFQKPKKRKSVKSASR